MNFFKGIFINVITSKKLTIINEHATIKIRKPKPSFISLKSSSSLEVPVISNRSNKLLNVFSSLSPIRK